MIVELMKEGKSEATNRDSLIYTLTTVTLKYNHSKQRKEGKEV
jgi:hypothetical protein